MLRGGGERKRDDESHRRPDGDLCAFGVSPHANHLLPQLGVDFLEVVLVHQDLALAAGRLRDDAFRFHHVDETRSAAEADFERSGDLNLEHQPRSNQRS